MARPQPDPINVSRPVVVHGLGTLGSWATALYPVSLSELELRDGDSARWSICLTELDGDDTRFVEMFAIDPPETEGKPLDAWIVDRIEALHPPGDDYLAQLESAQPINLNS